MKKHLLFLLMLSVLCLTGGCKDDDAPAPNSVYLYSTSVTVDAKAGAHSVTIFTTCAWEVSGDTWITIESFSGGDKGIYVVNLGYGENTTGEQRSGHVVFKAGTYTETFTMTQETN